MMFFFWVYDPTSFCVSHVRYLTSYIRQMVCVQEGYCSCLSTMRPVSTPLATLRALLISRVHTGAAEAVIAVIGHLYDLVLILELDEANDRAEDLFLCHPSCRW